MPPSPPVLPRLEAYEEAGAGAAQPLPAQAQQQELRRQVPLQGQQAVQQGQQGQQVVQQALQQQQQQAWRAPPRRLQQPL